MRKEFCNECSRDVYNKRGFCVNCGQFLERKFNEPLMWLGWETF